MPSLYFQIDLKWIEARVEDYIFDETGMGRECVLFILPVDMSMNILGAPVMVDYYTIHDVDNGTIGWAPHTDSPKSDIIETEVPNPAKLLKSYYELEAEAWGKQLRSRNVVLYWLQTLTFALIFILVWRYYVHPIFSKTDERRQYVHIYSFAYFVAMAILYYAVIVYVSDTILA